MYRTAILETDLTEDELVGAVDDALFAAAQKGMAPFAYQYTEDPSEDEMVHVWQGGHEGDVLRIVEDAPMACVYAVALSADPALVDQLIEALEGAFPRVGCDAVCAGLRETALDRPDALMQLTVCDSKNYHAPSEQLLLELSHSDDGDVRMVCVQAMGILGWPSLLAWLAEMEPGEPDPDIRKIIGFALHRDRS
jgi:HEAT repeat protein